MPYVLLPGPSTFDLNLTLSRPDFRFQSLLDGEKKPSGCFQVISD